MVIVDTALTMALLGSKGIDINPLVGTKEFDWAPHFWRIDVVLLFIPFIAMTKWKFTREWLLQGITVGYGWSVLNALCILLIGVDISIYQFLPVWAYVFGIIFQFSVGLGILWVFRRISERRVLDIH
jgi:hypothetical protein